MKKRNNIIAVAVWLVSIFMLARADVVLMFIPIILWPHIITHLGIIKAGSQEAQRLFLTALASYFLWSGFLYAVSINAGAWAGLGIVFASFWASPILLVIWIAALMCERKNRKANRALEAIA